MADSIISADLRSAMDISSAACAIFNNDGKLLVSNQLFDELIVQFPKEDFQFDNLELQAANFGKSIFWEDVQQKAFDQAFTMQVQMVQSPGRTYRVRLGAIEQNGSVVVMCFFSDITALSEMEMKLAERDSILDRVINEFPMMISAIDSDGIIRIWNNRCVEMTGYTALEMINNADALSLLFPNARQRFEILDKWKNRDNNVIRHWNMEVTCKDQTRKLISWTVRYREDAIVPGLHHWAVGMDITATQKAMIALRESEERFSIISKATNDAVYDWDMVTNELWWNDGMTDIFGYEDREIENTIDWWVEQIHPSFRDSVYQRLKEFIDAGSEFWSDEYPFMRKDGTYAYVFDKGFFIRNEAGVVVRMIGGMVDITREKEWERIALERDDQLIHLLEDEEENNTELIDRLIDYTQHIDQNEAVKTKLEVGLAQLKNRILSSENDAS